jgi:hypothetical protein
MSRRTEQMNTNMDNSGCNLDILGIKMMLQLLYMTMQNLPCSAVIPWARHADVQGLHGPAMLIV